MNPNHEELLYQLALTKPAADRVSWLDRECGDDKALHARLDALLAAQEQPETLLATQADKARPTIKLDLADDLHQATSFGERTLPMVWSAYTETADLSVAKALLARGLNVNETTGHGHTALDWAMKRGETPLVAYLRSQGATNSPPVARERAFPKTPSQPTRRSRRPFCGTPCSVPWRGCSARPTDFWPTALSSNLVASPATIRPCPRLHSAVPASAGCTQSLLWRRWLRRVSWVKAMGRASSGHVPRSAGLLREVTAAKAEAERIANASRVQTGFGRIRCDEVDGKRYPALRIVPDIQSSTI